MTTEKEPPKPEVEKTTGDFLDKVDKALDQDHEDDKTIRRMKNPFIQRIITSLIVLLFLLFATYFLSFIFKIPLPESKLFEGFMNTILEIMKLFLS